MTSTSLPGISVHGVDAARRLFKPAGSPDIAASTWAGTLAEAIGIRCGEELGRFLSRETAITLTGIERTGVPAQLAARPNERYLFNAEACRHPFAVELEADLNRSLIDQLYGGSGAIHGSDAGPPLTPFEREVGSVISQALMGGVCALLGITAPPTPVRERAGQRGSEVSEDLVHFKYRVSSAQGCFALGMPREFLAALRREQEQRPAEDETPVDRAWLDELRRATSAVSVDMSAISEPQQSTFGEIASLKPGSLLEFSGEILSRLRLEALGEPAFICKLGQSRGVFTVCLGPPVDARES